MRGVVMRKEERYGKEKMERRKMGGDNGRALQSHTRKADETRYTGSVAVGCKRWQVMAWRYLAEPLRAEASGKKRLEQQTRWCFMNVGVDMDQTGACLASSSLQ